MHFPRISAETRDHATPVILRRLQDAHVPKRTISFKHATVVNHVTPIPITGILQNSRSRLAYSTLRPADDDGFGQTLVVKNRQAASDPRVRQMTYGLHSSHLSFRLDPLSGMVSAVNLSNDEVAVSPTPLMWDSSGSPAVTDGQVGATAQPTEAESADPTDSPVETPSDTSGPTEDEVQSDEQSDTDVEVLPSASDGPEPTVSESPLPSVPAEPTPAPSQTGSAASLSLPSLDGPSPNSHGELVKADLSTGQWTLTPDQDATRPTSPATSPATSSPT